MRGEVVFGDCARLSKGASRGDHRRLAGGLIVERAQARRPLVEQGIHVVAGRALQGLGQGFADRVGVLRTCAEDADTVSSGEAKSASTTSIDGSNALRDWSSRTSRSACGLVCQRHGVSPLWITIGTTSDTCLASRY